MTTQQNLMIDIISTVGYQVATSNNAQQAWENAGVELINKFHMTQEEAADAIRFALSVLDK